MEAESKPLGEDTPKKKRHILRWIFNILCLLIVSLLFLVGVWTRNLNLLWLIIPIALWTAAFKRKLAGWLALGFLATIVCIVLWLFLPDSGNWRPYNFDYELKDLEAKRAVPDAENAAIAYQKIIARLDVNNAPPFYDGGKRNECNEPSTRIVWKGADHPETAAFVDARLDIITDAMAASVMGKCAFPVQTDPLNFSVDTVSGMRRLTYLLMSAANRDMGEGETGKALQNYKSVVRMGRQLDYQPSLIYLLVGMAIENLGSSRVSSAIVTADLTYEQLDDIRQMIPSTNDDWPQLWSTMAQYEKILTKNNLALAYEINDKGEIRFSRNPFPFPEKFRQVLPQPTTLDVKLTKLGAISGWFAYPHNPKDLSKMYDEEFERAEKLYDANRPESENNLDFKSSFKLWAKNPQRGLIFMLAQIAVPSHIKVHQLYLRTIAYRRTMHILLALREYKNANARWPDSLEQIKDKVPAEAMIDPFTGG
ncbi:MAG: hypothetical protein Q7T18_03215, partial [Sedimentisphaerales bacterium]|nr:hypothetical protein [Sedimentisphaerales bacterium]